MSFKHYFIMRLYRHQLCLNYSHFYRRKYFFRTYKILDDLLFTEFLKQRKPRSSNNTKNKYFTTTNESDKIITSLHYSMQMSLKHENFCCQKWLIWLNYRALICLQNKITKCVSYLSTGYWPFLSSFCVYEDILVILAWKRLNNWEVLLNIHTKSVHYRSL